MAKETSKKILVFDINPSNDEITKELIFGKISSVIKKAAINQHVIFLSHSNLSLLKKILINIDIKDAYIISDAGARIFDYKNNQILFEKKISSDAALATIHTGVVQNNLVLVSGATQELSYSYNYLHQSTLAKKHYIKLSCTNDFQKFIKFVTNNDIFSVMIFNNDYEKLVETYERFAKLSNE
jgi:hydroxymethylpyrimidine pyrophosphatase-like HAD family hydrolase